MFALALAVAAAAAIVLHALAPDHDHDHCVQPFVVRSSRVVTPSGVTPADVFIASDGKISRVAPIGDPASSSWGPVRDYGRLAVLPGLVDPHVHVNDPGTDWEGFASATAAAAAGGTTTILDMPLNSVPVTTTMDSLTEKIRAARSADLVADVGLIAGVVPDNLHVAPQLVRSGYVFALKSFMADSQNKLFPHLDLNTLRRAMQAISQLKVPYILHAELPAADIAPDYPGPDDSYTHYSNSRPQQWEVDAVREALRAAKETSCHIHIAHLASSAAALLVSEGIRTGIPATAETCPHYLAFAVESIPDRNPAFKCAPPIRDHRVRAALWGFVKDGTLSVISSDHSPAPPHLKFLESGNIRRAWGGIAGLQYRLVGTWTASRTYNWTLLDVADTMSRNPARLFGLHQKGEIAEGFDADLVLFDPEGETFITEADCLHRHKVSPFFGMTATGRVHETILRGETTYTGDGARTRGTPTRSPGRLLRLSDS